MLIDLVTNSFRSISYFVFILYPISLSLAVNYCYVSLKAFDYSANFLLYSLLRALILALVDP